MKALLNNVLHAYPRAALEVFAGHPIARLLRHDLPAALRAHIADDNYKLDGSAGSGQWAQTPWAAVFDRLVTESAQRGHYLVYLFRGDGAGVYLSLNQGTTAVQEQYKSQFIEILRARAKSFAAQLPKNMIEARVTGDLDLPGTGALTRGYAAGNVVANYYSADSLPDDGELFNDLQLFLNLYGLTVQVSDQWSSTDAGDVEAGDDTTPETESAQYRWHRRAERNRNLAKKAKKVHGYTCQVCSLNFEERYGDIGKGFIEAHHLTPFAELEGRPTELDPAKDFAVVCPNCHRMLHRTSPVLTVNQLTARLK